MKTLIYSISLITYLTILSSCGKNEGLNPINTSSEPTSNGIVNGQRVAFKDRKKYGAIILLAFPQGICTATHVGKGVLITAYHCVKAMNPKFVKEEDKPNLILVSPFNFKPEITKNTKDYEVVLPTDKIIKLSDEDMKKGKTPSTDLAIIKLKGEIAKTYEKEIPAAELTFQEVKVNEPGLQIAGYGEDQFEKETANFGKLNVGFANLVKVVENAYLLQYTNTEKFASAFHGDSGGPLFKFTNDDKLQLFGVTSRGIVPEEGVIDGVTTFAVNIYIRLDTDEVKAWIQEALK